MARETWHGTVTGYAVDRCRCAECRRAWCEYMRAYQQQPAVKAKRRAYQRAYQQRPAVKTKRRAYLLAYHAELQRLVKLAKQMEAQHGESPSA